MMNELNWLAARDPNVLPHGEDNPYLDTLEKLELEQDRMWKCLITDILRVCDIPCGTKTMEKVDQAVDEGDFADGFFQARIHDLSKLMKAWDTVSSLKN